MLYPPNTPLMQRLLFSLPAFYIVLEIPASEIKQVKEKKEDVKSTKENGASIINEFIKVTGHKTNIQTPIVYLSISNNHVLKLKKKKTTATIQIENYKTLPREIKEDKYIER